MMGAESATRRLVDEYAKGSDGQYAQTRQVRCSCQRPLSPFCRRCTCRRHCLCCLRCRRRRRCGRSCRCA